MTPQIPPLELLRLPDGAIRLSIGAITGTVSSDHLIEPKAEQLRSAWLRQATAPS